MPYREDNGIGFNVLFASILVTNRNALNVTVINYKVTELCIEHKLSAASLYRFADSFYNSRQTIRAYVRSCGIHNLARCAVLAKFFKHTAATLVLYSRGKLTVRKSACTALAELHIRLGI